jgi:hypothetical protein
MTDIVMPPSFPSTEFRAFLQATSQFFPAPLSDADIYDPQEKRRHFDWSWQAVRYRYRSCAECQDEFLALLANASETWRDGWHDEELAYKLERCIYLFFMGALSIFDSFAFCLYFLGMPSSRARSPTSAIRAKSRASPRRKPMVQRSRARR